MERTVAGRTPTALGRGSAGLSLRQHGLIFIGLNTLDWGSTQLLLSRGLGYEISPLMRALDVNFVAKMGLAALLLLLVVRLAKHPARMVRVLNIALCCIVVWNASWLIAGMRIVS